MRGRDAVFYGRKRDGAKKKDKVGTHALTLADNRAQRREGAKEEGMERKRFIVALDGF